jgi:hypothetical protein
MSYDFITDHHNIRQLKEIVEACKEKIESRIDNVHYRRYRNSMEAHKRVRNEARKAKAERNNQKRQKIENKEEVSEDEPVSDMENTQSDVYIDTDDDEVVSDHSSDNETQ